MLSDLVQILYFKYSKRCKIFTRKTILQTMIFFIVFTILFLSIPLLRVNEYTATQKRNPAIVWYTNQSNPGPISRKPAVTCYNGSKVLQCDVFTIDAAPEEVEAYLFYGYDIDKFPLPRDPKTIWGLFNDESPKAKPMLMYEKALNLFNFSYTFSRYSDVPSPLNWMLNLEDITSKKYFIETSIKNSFLDKIAPVVFFQRDCFTFTEREAYVKNLNKYINIDSYDSCPHYQVIRNYTMWLTENDLMKRLAQYKFIISIENAVCTDYMTEKLWRAIKIGVVPIYYGSPLIRDWLPNNKSAIIIEDFPTPKLLSQHLNYLLQNDTAYEEYLEHKTFGRISNQNLVTQTKASQTDDTDDKFMCLICERIHDRNSTRVNIVTKKHYDCLAPTSVLTLPENMTSTWQKLLQKAESKVDQILKEIEDSNSVRRSSNTSWDWRCLSNINKWEDIIYFCPDL